MEGKTTLVATSVSPDIGKVLCVPFSVGNGGRRPDIDALKFVVKFTVGNGNRPERSSVEFAVEFAVDDGKKPDLGAVGAGPEAELKGYAEALPLGNMPAETENVGIVVMFNVGKGRAVVEELTGFVSSRLPDGGSPDAIVKGA